MTTPPYVELPAAVDGLFDLTGRHCVVTGGAAGISAAVAVGFARYGADITVLDLDEDGAQATVGLIEAQGRSGRFIRADATDLGSLEDAVAAIRSDGRAVDVCFAGVGGGMRASIAETTPEAFMRIVNLNLVATWNTAKAMGGPLAEAEAGSFISVASIHGHVADPNQGAYAPSKAAVVQLTKVLALEWASLGVRANCLSPSHITTQRVQNIIDDAVEYERILAKSPMHRFGEPWELIGPAVFLASRASGFVTGHALLVDGGWTLS